MYQRDQDDDELARYERFVRRELPSALQLEVQLFIEQEKGQFVDIVRNALLQVFQSYVPSRRSNASVPQPTSATNTAQRQSQDSASCKNDVTPVEEEAEGTDWRDQAALEAMLDDIAAYDAPPIMEDSLEGDFPAAVFDWHERGDHVDPGNFQNSTNGSARSNLEKKNMQVEKEHNPTAWFDSSALDNGEGPSGTR